MIQGIISILLSQDGIYQLCMIFFIIIHSETGRKKDFVKSGKFATNIGGMIFYQTTEIP